MIFVKCDIISIDLEVVLFSIGIYGKKALFFTGVLLILGLIVYFVSGQFSSASINEASYEKTTNKYVVDVNIKENASVEINGKTFNNLMHLEKDDDLFRYLAVSEESSYIEDLTIYVHLPKPVDPEQVQQTVYAVHGIEASDFYVQDSQTLVYRAQQLSPFSSFTIIAQLPKGTVDFPITAKFFYALSNISPMIWLIVSLALPLLTLILLFWLFKQKINDWQMAKPKDELSVPPSDLTPGEVEILFFGKISSRSIAATLLSMAQRKYINIVQKEGEFSFGVANLYNQITKEFSPGLTEPEKILASKIFTKDTMSSKREDILFRIGRHVFSKKIAKVYIAFYNQMANKGYFVDNPAKFHRKYYVIGLVLFFLALTAFIGGIWILPDESKFLLVFWFMMIMSSLVIVRMAPQIPLRTKLGKEELVKWLKFKNYLSSRQSINFEDATQDVFEKYLPYAIVMGCEVEWAKRFLDRPFKLPDWYISERPVTVLEDFMASVFPIIGFVSRSLVASKEPIVH